MPHTCPLCHQPSERLFLAHGYWIRSCRVCGHQFAEVDRLRAPELHAESVYSDAYFTAGSSGYTDYLGEAKLLRARGRHYARLLRRHCATGSLLDIGCAAGFTLAGFVDGGWNVLGIEPNDTMAAYGRTRLALDIRTGTLEGLDEDIGGPFDIISMLQVLPHFLDPVRAMSIASRNLCPGGFLLIETWDRDSFAQRVFGPSWHEYAPPSVLHWFNRAGLTALAKNHGMAHVRSGRPPKWIQASHALSAARSASENRFTKFVLGLACAMAPARLALPYPGDDIFYSIFRNSIKLNRNAGTFNAEPISST